MKKLILIMLLLAATASFAAIDTITSSVCFQTPDGTCAANGVLYLTLSQHATISTNGQVAPKVVKITLTAGGLIPANQHIWGNDQLLPSGTTYSASLYDSAGNPLANWADCPWSIAGASPIDLSTLACSTSGASYPNAVLQSASGNQTITGGTLTDASGFVGPVTGDVTSAGTSTFSNIHLPAVAGTGNVYSLQGMTDCSTAIPAESTFYSGGSWATGQSKHYFIGCKTIGSPNSYTFFMHSQTSATTPENEFRLAAYYNPGLIQDNLFDGTNHRASHVFRARGLSRWEMDSDPNAIEQDPNSCGAQAYTNGVSSCGLSEFALTQWNNGTNGAAPINSHARMTFFPILETFATNAGDGTSAQWKTYGNLLNVGSVTSVAANDTTGRAAITLQRVSPGSEQLWLRLNSTVSSRILEFASARDGGTTYWTFNTDGTLSAGSGVKITSAALTTPDIGAATGTSLTVPAGGLQTGSVAVGYALNIPHATFASPLDATTYYFAVGGTLTSTANLSRWYIPRAGTIAGAYVYTHVSGTLGTTENVTYAIRKNNATDSTTATETWAAADQAVNWNPNLAVAAGDYIEVKITTPTWATNPTNVYETIVIWIAE